jgi:uncharacterized iron-regulated membrane protein
MAVADEAVTAQEQSPPRARPARRRRGRPVKRATIWLHRWSSLVLGLALLAVTTSGAVLVYEPELSRMLQRDAWAEAGPAELSLVDALGVVAAHDPEFVVQAVNSAHGTYVAENYDTPRKVHVDPGSGTVLYDSAAGNAGWGVWLLDLTRNLHACGLTCPEYPGHQAWLAAEVPGSQWAGFDGAAITWGGLLLGVTAVLLLFLAVSGMWLWWPGVRRWAHGFRVRWRRGRYARDYDLHQVAGMLAVPLLLLWAVTGAGFEFGFVGDAWYAALPGEAETAEFASAEGDGPDIGPAVAVAAAQRELGTTAPPVGLNLPAADEPTATYTVWLSSGFDPYGRTDYPGDVGVDVDRRTGAAEITFGDPAAPLAAQLWEAWNYPTHTGWVVGPWWRLPWLVAGLSPLLLAATGVSTWLYTRGTRKRRRAAARQRAAAGPVPATAATTEGAEVKPATQTAREPTS